MRAAKIAAFTAGAVLTLLGGLGLPSRPAQAASHSDAPLIKLDPQANLTDVYAFIGQRSGTKVLNVIVHVRPFSEPGDGVIYDRFSPDALYSIHITNPTTGAEFRRYDFQFSDVSGAGGIYKNLDTILSYGRGTEIGPIQNVDDARQNFTQTYSLTKFQGTSRTGNPLNAGMTLKVPPPNVGARTTPLYNGADGKAVSGATTRDGLDPYTRQTIYDLPSGETVFAGPREDGFYSDIPGIFDLLDPRILDTNGSLADGLGQDGNGVDGFKGFNILAYALQIPVDQLQGVTGFPKVGVYASVSRPSLSLAGGIRARFVRTFTQVNRMGNPLFNEGFVALRDKDRFNATKPTGDAAFDRYARNPEFAVLINATFGTNMQTGNRTDLVGIFIPDVLRVDTATDPVRLAGQPGFSRLSLFGGDLMNGAPGGWPNGRRLGDDVVDIALTALASGPSFSTVTLVGDNVPANDQVYNQVFPYSGTPHSGTRSSKDSGVNDQ